MQAARRIALCVGLGCWVSAFHGCGDDSIQQRAAYKEAVAAVDRERTTLKNVQAEQQRVYGEYLLHDFEGRAWAGTVSPSAALGLPWSIDDYQREPPLYVYLHDKLPLGWFGQLDRLLCDKPELLPWFSRTQGDLHRRRIYERFSKLLSDLRDRLSLQADRVRNAQEYARLIQPDEAKP